MRVQTTGLMTALVIAVVVGGAAISRADGTAVAAAAPSSIEARLKVQEDTEAIRRVLREYGKTLDAGDLRAYANLFAVDGEWVGGFGTVKGRDAIAPYMEKNMRTPLPSVEGTAAAAAPPRPGPRGVHLMTNEIIDVNGDRASSWSKWTYITRSADNKPVIALEGHYDDTYVREKGQWKFQRRVVTSDIPFSDPLAEKQAAPSR